MSFDFVDWDEEDDPRGNVWHIADHGLSTEEVDQVLHDPKSQGIQSRSSGRPGLIGWTSSGKKIIVIYERSLKAGVSVVRPVTAYEIKD